MKHLNRTLTTLLLSATLAWALPGYKQLCAELPDLSGWKAEQCSGMTMSNPMLGGEMVTASRTYTKGDASLEVTVVTGMQAMMMWAPYSSGMQMENDEELIKIEKIDGFGVGIGYDKKAHSGTIVVQLSQNAVLGVTFEGMQWQEALKEAKKLHWRKLRALFH